MDPADHELAQKPIKPVVKSMVSEAIRPKSNVDLERQFFVNVLMQYPKDGLLPSMVQFSNLFFKKMHTQGLTEPKTLRHVLMTSFGFELELLTSVINSTQKYLLVNDSSDGQFELKECFNGHKNMTAIFPSKSHKGYGFGAFHPKLWLIEFEDNSLRVVVGSGNLSIADWTVWSNCLWYKDFKQRIDTKGIDAKKSSDPKGKEFDAQFEQKDGFGEYLTDFMEKIVPKGVDNLNKFGGINLNNYDFDMPIEPLLVSSVPGRHIVGGPEKKPVLCYGLERLKKIMISHPPSKATPPTDVRIVYQTSSVGQLSSAFLIRFLGKTQIT